MIEKLQKVNDQDPQLDLNQKYFKFINKYKNLSSPLKWIDIQNKDTHFESFGLRKFSTEIRNFNPPKGMKLIELFNYLHQTMKITQLNKNDVLFRESLPEKGVNFYNEFSDQYMMHRSRAKSNLKVSFDEHFALD